MTGQLNQVSNISRQSNELSDDDEPDLQQINKLQKSRSKTIQINNILNETNIWMNNLNTI